MLQQKMLKNCQHFSTIKQQVSKKKNGNIFVLEAFVSKTLRLIFAEKSTSGKFSGS
jgi:hypothetical protein